jgi:hypothetical protein
MGEGPGSIKDPDILMSQIEMGRKLGALMVAWHNINRDSGVGYFKEGFIGSINNSGRDPALGE